MVVDGCGRFWIVVEVVGGNGWLCVVVGGFGWLYVLVGDCML